MATATAVPVPVPVPVPSSDNNFETIENMLYSPEMTVNPGEIIVLPPTDSNKPMKVIQKKLSPQTIRYIVKKKRQLANEVKRLKIKNPISNSILFDEILNDKEKRNEKQKCSEILGFTFRERELSSTELTNFGFNAMKTFYIIDGVSCGSVAEIIGFKVGDVIIGMYNSDNNAKQLLDYNDDEALYNLKGNMLFNDKTILYINIRIFRYDENLKADYVDISPFFEKYNYDDNVLYHGRRFIIPYLNNPTNTITRFGSLYFKDYISDLTDFEQVGGGPNQIAMYNAAATFVQRLVQLITQILQRCDAILNIARTFANPSVQFQRRLAWAQTIYNLLTNDGNGLPFDMNNVVQRNNFLRARFFTLALQNDAHGNVQPDSKNAADGAARCAHLIGQRTLTIARRAENITNLLAPFLDASQPAALAAAQAAQAAQADQAVARQAAALAAQADQTAQAAALVAAQAALAAQQAVAPPLNPLNAPAIQAADLAATQAAAQAAQSAQAAIQAAAQAAVRAAQAAVAAGLAATQAAVASPAVTAAKLNIVNDIHQFRNEAFTFYTAKALYRVQEDVVAQAAIAPAQAAVDQAAAQILAHQGAANQAAGDIAAADAQILAARAAIERARRVTPRVQAAIDQATQNRIAAKAARTAGRTAQTAAATALRQATRASAAAVTALDRANAAAQVTLNETADANREYAAAQADQVPAQADQVAAQAAAQAAAGFISPVLTQAAQDANQAALDAQAANLAAQNALGLIPPQAPPLLPAQTALAAAIAAAQTATQAALAAGVPNENALQQAADQAAGAAAPAARDIAAANAAAGLAAAQAPPSYAAATAVQQAAAAAGLAAAQAQAANANAVAAVQNAAAAVQSAAVTNQAAIAAGVAVAAQVQAAAAAAAAAAQAQALAIGAALRPRAQAAPPPLPRAAVQMAPRPVAQAAAQMAPRPLLPQAAIYQAASRPIARASIVTKLRLDILPEPTPQQQVDMSKQRILLINLYLNQIFNTILLNNTLKKKSSSNFVNLTIISRYKNKRSNPNHPFDFPDFPIKKIDDGANDKKIISKINSLLDQDKLISSTSCYNESESAAAAGGSGGLNKNKNIYPLRRRKQKTIKKQIRNIKNKNSLKYKIRNKINKCIKKCIKKNSIQQQNQQKQKENKVRIKKFLNSKIYEKINKFKLNKTKNYSKSKSYSNKYTRKNY